jgi:hypothetical protein
MVDIPGEIFISYKSERRRAAEHLAETLRHNGYMVWFNYQLVKGKDFARQIDARIRGAGALIVLWCTRSVGSEACGNISAKASRLDFVLDGRVALKPRHRDEVQVQQGQVGKRREMRLQTDCGHVGVDSDSQIVCRDLKDIVTHPAGIVRVVRECLGVRQQ